MTDINPLGANIDQGVELHGSLQVIANFAWQHLKAATISRDRVVVLESENLNEPFGAFAEEIRAYASACIMSSTASLEALINEFFIAHNCRLRSHFNDFEKEFWGKQGIERKQILDKYQHALEILGVTKLDKQSSPYRNAWALIELRNALVHYKPTWDPDRGRKVQLIEVLEELFPLSPFFDVNADFVSERCMCAGCSQWAVKTTVSFMREFHERANLDPNKMEGFWMLET